MGENADAGDAGLAGTGKSFVAARVSANGAPWTRSRCRRRWAPKPTTQSDRRPRDPALG
jgi:hypothetical protein